MRKRRLGRTDLGVSVICLGTMGFGWTADEDASFRVLDAFVAAGGNFIDTSDIYMPRPPGHAGLSEEIIGRWMKSRGNRERLVLATKVRGRMWDGPDGEGLSRAHIERAIEGSLRRLQVEYVDLYQCHWPDEATPIAETLGAFRELIGAGKVRHIGASNYSAEQFGEALRVADEQGLPPFETLQPHYSLVHRSEFEAALQGLCIQEDIGVIPYSPLAGGFLTGKYRPAEPLPNSQRAGGAHRYMTEQGFRVLEMVEAIAAAHGTTTPAVALAWLAAQSAVVAPITGANSPEQLAQLLPAAELTLSGEEIRVLSGASAGT